MVPRFSSEYGAQSLPSMSSLNQIATEEDLQSLNTEFFMHRQHLPLGNLYLIYQMLLQFSAPRLDDLTSIVYLSQVCAVLTLIKSFSYASKFMSFWNFTGEPSVGSEDSDGMVSYMEKYIARGWQREDNGGNVLATE